MTSPDDGNKDQKTSRFLRTASFWALVILIPLAIFQVMETSRQLERELTYTEFREQLEGDNVRSVTFSETRKVEGELRTPLQVDGQPVDQFHTLLPMEASQELIDQLEALGVEVKAEETV